MLTIDLLKGQGIPIKTRPAGASLFAVAVAVPIVVIIVTLGNYVRGGIMLRNQRRLLTTIQADIFKFTDSVKFKQQAEKRINAVSACFVEVDDTLPQQIQWSPILRELAENMPASLVLSGLNIKTELQNKLVPQRKTPSKMTAIQVPKRVLYINLYGRRTRGSDEAVLKLLGVLNASMVMRERADNIRLVAQATDAKQNVMNYVIECVFRPD